MQSIDNEHHCDNYKVQKIQGEKSCVKNKIKIAVTPLSRDRTVGTDCISCSLLSKYVSVSLHCFKWNPTQNTVQKSVTVWKEKAIPDPVSTTPLSPSLPPVFGNQEA